jgi:hypothetical protein
LKRPKPDFDFVAEQAARMHYLLRQRAALPRDDLEYMVDKVANLRDQRLQQCVAELIGWGDEERSEIETFVAIAVEVMKRTRVTTLRESARVVELRYMLKQTAEQAAPAAGHIPGTGTGPAHAARAG